MIPARLRGALNRANSSMRSAAFWSAGSPVTFAAKSTGSPLTHGSHTGASPSLRPSRPSFFWFTTASFAKSTTRSVSPNSNSACAAVPCSQARRCIASIAFFAFSSRIASTSRAASPEDPEIGDTAARSAPTANEERPSTPPARATLRRKARRGSSGFMEQGGSGVPGRGGQRTMTGRDARASPVWPRRIIGQGRDATSPWSPGKISGRAPARTARAHPPAGATK